MSQPNMNLYSKVELLNEDFKIMDSLEGNLISDSFSNTSDSAVRRTYQMSLNVTDSTFDIVKDKKFWFDRIIRPYIGILNLQTDEIKWYLIGTFVITDDSITYDATSHTLTLNCSDMMCLYNGERGSQLEGFEFVIYEGEDVRTSIIGLLKSAGIIKYNVAAISETIPYDLEFNTGVTLYEILNTILELFTGWEMFFDIDGTFVWQQIPTCYDDRIVLDYDTIKTILISESPAYDMKNVFNKTVVWGDVIEPDFYSDDVISTGLTYRANVSAMTSYENGDKVAIKVPCTNKNYPTLNINNLGAIQICDDAGDRIRMDEFDPDTVYVFKYRKKNPNNEADFYLLGQYQPYGEYIEMDVNCPYSVQNMDNKILSQTITSDTAYSDDLARQLAEYTTYQSCKLSDSLSITTLPILFLDVNQKIEYLPMDREQDGINQYIITSISSSSSEGTMSISLRKFYEDYSVVYNKKYGRWFKTNRKDFDTVIYDCSSGWSNSYNATTFSGSVSHIGNRGLNLQSKTVTSRIFSGYSYADIDDVPTVVRVTLGTSYQHWNNTDTYVGTYSSVDAFKNSDDYNKMYDNNLSSDGSIRPIGGKTYRITTIARPPRRIRNYRETVSYEFQSYIGTNSSYNSPLKYTRNLEMLVEEMTGSFIVQFEYQKDGRTYTSNLGTINSYGDYVYTLPNECTKYNWRIKLCNSNSSNILNCYVSGISLNILADELNDYGVYPPGLYNANGRMLIDWETLVSKYNVNVQTNYTSSNYSTTKTSMAYILNNCEELKETTKIVLPSTANHENGVTTIGSYCFYGCSKLTEIIFADSIRNIYTYAFYGCTGLKKITIPISATIASTASFGNCTNINKVEVINGTGSYNIVTSSSNYTYTPWYIARGNIQKIVFGENITKIGTYTLYNCTNLNTIFIPKSVTTIEDYATYGCSNLKTINYEGTEEEWNQITIGTNNVLSNVTINYNSILIKQ